MEYRDIVEEYKMIHIEGSRQHGYRLGDVQLWESYRTTLASTQHNNACSVIAEIVDGNYLNILDMAHTVRSDLLGVLPSGDRLSSPSDARDAGPERSLYGVLSTHPPTQDVCLAVRLCLGNTFYKMARWGSVSQFRVFVAALKTADASQRDALEKMLSQLQVYSAQIHSCIEVDFETKPNLRFDKELKAINEQLLVLEDCRFPLQSHGPDE